MPFASQSAPSSSSRAGEASRTAYKVLYDGQCEICQAFISWLRVLDAYGQTDPIPISAEALARINRLSPLAPRLELDACLRELHVVASAGRIYRGWDAVARLARLFPLTWIIGAIGSVPPFQQIARAAYRFVARNRHSLSKCRGGACQVARPAAVRKQATLGAFWSCYSLGLIIRLPLVAWSALRGAADRLWLFAQTYGSRLDLLDGKLTLFFLNGLCPNAVPILFGELFTAILYNGVIVDPGSPKMRRSLARHVRPIPLGAIRCIVATHAHEEHVGNLRWLAQRTGAAIYVSPMTAQFLETPVKLPWARNLIIGQPPALAPPFEILRDSVPTAGARLEIIPTPGHCDDHISLYDPAEKLLLAGDTFMGSYFSTPNPDVDSRVWLETLQRLAALDIEILVEGHGHIHTLRADIPDIPGIVIREHPAAAIAAKLDYMRWLRRQIEDGLAEGFPLRAIEATCFPWSRKTTWENFASDEMIRVLSLGHFSRTELVRSFVRPDSSGPADVLPQVYEVRLYRGDDSPS